MNDLTVQPQRQPFPATLLHKCIDEIVVALTDQQQEFTAYTVTMLLRAQYAHMEVVHEDVRQRVHYYMDNLHDHLVRPYDKEDRLYPDGNTALTYVPLYQIVAPPVKISVSQPPALPAPGIEIEW